MRQLYSLGYGAMKRGLSVHGEVNLEVMWVVCSTVLHRYE